MPTRMVRDGILTSDRINALSTNAELFYRRLMSVVDDYGRFPSNPQLLRASCYPLKLDSVKEDSISKHLAECVDARLIVLYTVDSKAYLEVQDFGQRINGKPKYPGQDQGSPGIPGDSPELPGIPGLVVVVGGGVDEGGDESPRKRGKSPKRSLPDDFSVSERVAHWAEREGFAGLDRHMEAFTRKCLANGYRYADWDAAFMEAVRGDWAKLREKPFQRGSSGDADLDYALQVAK